MAKDTFWFNHDFNARNDEKILELRANYGAEAYGIYWMLIETMAENSNGAINKSLIGGLSLSYGVAKDTLKDIIDFSVSINLLFEENGHLFSKRLNKYREFRQHFKDKGKEGAEKRWKNREAIGEANAKDKIGEDKIIEDNSLLSLNSEKNGKNSSPQWLEIMEKIKKANPTVEHLNPKS